MSILRVLEDSGEVTYFSEEHGTQVRLPPADELVFASQPVQAMEHALDGLGELLTTTKAVQSNPELSDIGRAKRIEPYQASALGRIARAQTIIDRHDADIASREAALLAVPKIGDATPTEAILDRERRDYWRSLPPQERAQMLESINADPAGNELMLIALLRSPVPQAAHEMQVARDVWGRVKREGNPAEAASIDAAKQASEWAKRALAHVVGLTTQTTRWTPSRILQHLVGSSNEFESNGVKAFGFSDVDVARAKQLIQQKAKSA